MRIARRIILATIAAGIVIGSLSTGVADAAYPPPHPVCGVIKACLQ